MQNITWLFSLKQEIEAIQSILIHLFIKIERVLLSSQEMHYAVWMYAQTPHKTDW